MTTESVNLLVVDDDDVCQMLVARAMQDVQSPVRIVAATGGSEAIALLRSTKEKPEITRPLVILLDLRMPQMDGFEFLEILREDSNLRDLPVFVLTTSNHDCDVKRAYHFNVAGYLVKPMEYSALKEKISMVDHYCRRVTLPNDSVVPDPEAKCVN